ncbi:MAG: DNA-binding response regulator [Myxococcaceae bacterium]|nr:DNA-binding response regulator [Myxococcaceae bacterium]
MQAQNQEFPLDALSSRKRLLIVGGDASRGAVLVDELDRAGFEASHHTERRALTNEEVARLDVILLDPATATDEPANNDLDALGLVAVLRTFSDVPIVVVSNVTDTAEKVRALRLGADDYVTMPFAIEELVERVRARLRRPTLARDTDGAGHLRIDRVRREVRVDGTRIDMTRVEFDILAVLAEKRGGAVSRRALALRVLDPARDGDERTLDVHVSRIRKKLGTGTFVETVWGVGYRLLPGREA